MDCTNYESLRFHPAHSGTGRMVRTGLIATLVVLVVTLTVILGLDHAHIHLPVTELGVVTGASAGQA